MKRWLPMLAAAALGLASAQALPWSLSDHLEDLLVYDTTGSLRIPWTGVRYQHDGMIVMRCAWRDGDTLVEHDERMRVGGTSREGQILVAGLTNRPLVAEFTVLDGTRIDIEYGFADFALFNRAQPAAVTVTIEADGRTVERSFRVADPDWKTIAVEFDGDGPARVRIASERTGAGSYHWPMFVVRGDGRVASREVTVARNPRAGELQDPVHPPGITDVAELTPSPWRVTRPADRDILFFRDRPFLSFATKGNRAGFQRMEVEFGFNTSYQEGRAFVVHWPEGAPKPVWDRQRDALFRDLAICRELDIPFKTSMSLAHCTPFFPHWLVEQENLGPEGHQSRRGGPTHASIFKAATLEGYKRGLTGWVDPHRDQPTIFVFSQEDNPENLDDRSEEAQARWRAWLRDRFDDDFSALSSYVGGLRDVDGFAGAPYPNRYDPTPEAGYGQRLNWLKIVWVLETYGDFLVEAFAHTRDLMPDVPLTQRYVYSPWGIYLSRRVGSDYNYTFGHLTAEARPHVTGVGRKIWTAAHGHVGVLPLPRGGSIGKCWDATVRRGPATENELRANLFTLLANGASGFEYQPFFPVWGESWETAALADFTGEPTELGAIAARVIGEAHNLADRLHRYEEVPDVAVFHDAVALSRGALSARANPSKYGLYTLIREFGYHSAPLTLWDMTEEGLRDHRVLVLAGTTAMAPEIQNAVRAYVRGGGTLVAFYTAPGGGFPGCNSYDFTGPFDENAAVRSFAPGGLHLGDLLGIRDGGSPGEAQAIRGFGADVDLGEVNALVAEGKWMEAPVAARGVVLDADAEVLATFEDGSPAAWRRAYGEGRVYGVAYDLPVIASNLTIPELYRPWDELFASLGCRKAFDTGDYFVESGVWQDDAGQRTVFLINHDAETSRAVALPDGEVLRLAPGESRAHTRAP